VVIPVRDGEEFVADAVSSALDQTHVPIEVLVVDDGSGDGSAPAAHRAGATVLTRDRQGPGAARNAGAAEAGADLIAFLDADDRMRPNRLSHQVAHLMACPAAIGVFGMIGHLLRDPATGGWREATDQPVEGLLPSTLTVRRAPFLATGGFAEDLPAGELVDWLARCRMAGLTLPVVPEVVTLRRAHSSNLTRDRSALRRGYLETARRSVERHRRPG
jgi:glycosyltransferase involved in cell wall biosynthesis